MNAKLQKLKRTKKYPLTPTPHPVVQGDLYDVKLFPDSREGKPAPGSAPNTPGPGSAFPVWVDYYVGSIAKHLEYLNGIQFDLDEYNNDSAQQSAATAQFTAKLQSLARLLEVGQPGNPGMLAWPMHGLHRFQLRDASVMADFTNGLEMELCFERDDDYRIIVNSEVRIWAVQSLGLRAGQSSSSYLATSSSSH